MDINNIFIWIFDVVLTAYTNIALGASLLY